MEENLSPQQSLQVIQSMISKAKGDLTENKFYFLLWGWMAFTAIILQFVLKVWMQYPYHYAVWLLAIPAIIITIIHSARRDKKANVRTYIGESMGHLWTGMGISFFVLSMIITLSNDWVHGFPFFILFYGLGTFVSGRILQFNPLVIGGILNWAIAIASAMVTYDYQLLLAAFAILTSYIIPGHLLNKKTN